MREINTCIYKLELLYLDYFNNFSTIEKFAEFYGISEDKAITLIDIGRIINLKGITGSNFIALKGLKWLTL